MPATKKVTKRKKQRSDEDIAEEYGYIIRLLGQPKYLHLDPLNGDYWAGKQGAFQFRSEFDAAKYGPGYTKMLAFEIIPVPLEV